MTGVTAYYLPSESLDTLKDVPTDFGRVGEKEVAESIALAAETMAVGGALVGMAEIACK